MHGDLGIAQTRVVTVEMVSSSWSLLVLVVYSLYWAVVLGSYYVGELRYSILHPVNYFVNEHLWILEYKQL